MDLSKVALAARNNAGWCDTVCRAHGQATEFTSGLWRCLGTPPRFYPGAVSLATGAAPLVRDHRPVAFKDSFHDVDLSGHGYAVAFEATWIWREASGAPSSFLRWDTITSDDRLREWEQVWNQPGDTAVCAPRQFPAALLEDPDVVFLAGYEGRRLVAGGVLNLTPPVVGLSNVFCLDGASPPLFAALVAASGERFPGCPVVGYESEDVLQQALAAGFEPVGPLRVWVS